MDRGTIVALCTGVPPTAVAMIRLSGPEAYRIAASVFDPFSFEPRRAQYGRFTFGDDGLALLFSHGASYTGDETVEFTLHGGRASIDALLGACLAAGARPAKGGEFTLRAFMNGRIDLTQAEAVVETVEAMTEAELRMTHRNRTGLLKEAVQLVREDLRAILAEVEARIDFSEELGDLDPQVVSERCGDLAHRISELLERGHSVHLARRGRRVALVGRPNAGKSSLLNRLVGHDRAIVTNIPGTTRDTIEETIVLGAARLLIIDTAGLRETNDQVEAHGVQRSRQAASEADEVWFLYDSVAGWTSEDDALIADLDRQPDVILATKSDLATSERGIAISSITGEGIGELASRYPEPPEAPPVNDRQAAALLPAAQVLREAAAISDAPPDLLAVLLRQADRELGIVLGDTMPADLLNELFSRFCIGK